jgi:hypothetical protein
MGAILKQQTIIHFMWKSEWLLTFLFWHKRIRSAVKRAELVSDGMLYIHGECPVLSNILYYAFPHKNRYTLLLVNISLYFVLHLVFSFVFFYIYPMPYSIPSFLNVTVLRYNVFTRAVYKAKLALVDWCTTYTAVALYFHTKRLKEDRHKRLDRLCGIG